MGARGSATGKLCGELAVVCLVLLFMERLRGVESLRENCCICFTYRAMSLSW